MLQNNKLPGVTKKCWTCPHTIETLYLLPRFVTHEGTEVDDETFLLLLCLQLHTVVVRWNLVLPSCGLWWRYLFNMWYLYNYPQYPEYVKEIYLLLKNASIYYMKILIHIEVQDKESELANVCGHLLLPEFLRKKSANVSMLSNFLSMSVARSQSCLFPTEDISLKRL